MIAVASENGFGAPMLTGTTVGERIRSARDAKKMTQLDLATKLGVSRAAVGQWEIDSTSPSIQKVKEAAQLLGVDPEWIAYGVRAGETKIVYRSPQRDDMSFVREEAFGETVEDRVEGQAYGLPAKLFQRLRANPETVFLFEVPGHSVAPEYEYGDLVIVDEADTKPSPGGVFLYWDGLAAALARFTMRPTKEGVLVRIAAQGQETLELPLDEVNIIGRVKGKISQ